MCSYAPIHVKWYMFQLLSALDYLHKNNIMHRDLKTSNILVSNSHVIKLTDFGLARTLKFGNDINYTNNVMTLWYRPPELLLGERHYATKADIWSAGCIFGELLTGTPIFPTHSGDEVSLHINGINSPNTSLHPPFFSLCLSLARRIARHFQSMWSSRR